MAILLTILLILNVLQTKRADPLNTKAMNVLLEQLKQTPDDQQLRNEIRALDLLARKAFFTSQWQVKTGGVLLFLSVLIFLASFQYIDYFRKRLPEPPAISEQSFWERRTEIRKWIGWSSLFLLFMAIAFVWIDQPSLEDYLAHGKIDPKKQTANQNPASNNPNTTSQKDSLLATSSDSLPVVDSSNSSAKSHGNWPFFRGPGSNGVAHVKNVPTTWDGKSGKNIRWKTEIPLPGYNSPIVWNEKVFLTGANESKREVYCLHVEDGKILWKVAVDNISGSPSQVPKVNHETGFSAPTMATDGKRVYAIFANGDLIALDMEGKKVWAKNIGLPKNHYGHSSSLMCYQENVIIQFDQTGNANVIALSGKTGNEVWRTNRNVRVSWASPVLVNTGNRQELLLAADPSIISYDPSSGKELWKMDAISGEVGPSAAYANGIVFSVNDYSKLAAIQIGNPPTQLWEDDEYLSDVPSPVATSTYLFLSTSYGTLVCYDAKTGTRHWVKEFGTQTYSSPILADGKIYLLNSKGIMHIVKADKTFSSVGEPKLGEGSFCTPAFLNDMILIRGDKFLYCISE